MPTGQLLPGQKVWPSFPYPPSGKVRLFVESDKPVDIFISDMETAKQISSVSDAAQFVPKVLIYTAQTQLDQIINLSKLWQSGWTLTIGYPKHKQGTAAVHYAVYPL